MVRSHAPVGAVDSPRLPGFYGLSFAAGCVDALSFLGFGGVFTANMTGNTVLLGIAIAAKFRLLPMSTGIVPPAMAIAAFVGGGLLTVPLFRNGFDARKMAAVVLFETVLVIVAGLACRFPGRTFLVPFCIALVSFAMGAQSVAVWKAKLPGISTTYVTGTLVTAIVHAFSGKAGDQQRRDALHDVRSWTAYLGGTAAGALLLSVLHRAALLVTAAFFIGSAAWFYSKGNRLNAVLSSNDPRSTAAGESRNSVRAH